MCERMGVNMQRSGLSVGAGVLAAHPSVAGRGLAGREVRAEEQQQQWAESGRHTGWFSGLVGNGSGRGGEGEEETQTERRRERMNERTKEGRKD